MQAIDSGAGPAPGAAGTPLKAVMAGAWPLPWPGRCALCRGWCTARLCSACTSRLAPLRPRCGRCARPLALAHPSCGACHGRPQATSATVVALDYGPPWDRLITGLKFDQRLDLAGALAGLLQAAVQARADLPLPHLVLPVPLGPRRLRQRGYNQAWLLARPLARALHLPAEARLLLRLHDTDAQSDLPRAQRLLNLQGAFLVEPRRAFALQGRQVALVDDVTTTGATAEAAATALRQAGAAGVQLWALARTPAPDED